MINSFKLDGKVALVTGAVHGIGFALVKALHQAGAKVIFNARNIESVRVAEQAYLDEGITAKGYAFDVTKKEQVSNAIKTIEQEVGIIDILVNNAGIIKRVGMLDMEVEDWNEVIDVDLTGPFIMSQAVIPSMIKKGHGKIINITSMMSELGRETVSAYASAKGGLKMLTKNIAAEFGHHNIQCNAIGPGYIETPQTAPLRVDGHPFNTFILDKTLQNRWGKTEDLMGPVVFLALDASNFVNGHSLYVDGGILASIGKQPK